MRKSHKNNKLCCTRQNSSSTFDFNRMHRAPGLKPLHAEQSRTQKQSCCTVASQFAVHIEQRQNQRTVLLAVNKP